MPEEYFEITASLHEYVRQNWEELLQYMAVVIQVISIRCDSVHFFRRVRKITKSHFKLGHVPLFVCPAVRMEHLVPTGRIFMKFDISVFFENMSRKFKFH
jgi:hypothetical protein